MTIRYAKVVPVFFRAVLVHVSNIWPLVTGSSLGTLTVCIYPWELRYQELEWLMKDCQISSIHIKIYLSYQYDTKAWKLHSDLHWCNSVKVHQSYFLFLAEWRSCCFILGTICPWCIKYHIMPPWKAILWKKRDGRRKCTSLKKKKRAINDLLCALQVDCLHTQSKPVSCNQFLLRILCLSTPRRKKRRPVKRSWLRLKGKSRCQRQDWGRLNCLNQKMESKTSSSVAAWVP